jgi:hypothetical protein
MPKKLQLTKLQVKEMYERDMRRRTAERLAKLVTHPPKKCVASEKAVRPAEAKDNTVCLNLSCLVVILVVCIMLLLQKLWLIQKE